MKRVRKCTECQCELTPTNRSVQRPERCLSCAWEDETPERAALRAEAQANGKQVKS